MSYACTHKGGGLYRACASICICVSIYLITKIVYSGWVGDFFTCNFLLLSDNDQLISQKTQWIK